MQVDVSAVLRGVRISAQKARLVANQIRRKPVHKAVDILEFSQKKAASIIKKVLHSAISNAEHNHSFDIDCLVISEIFVDEGPTLKRMRPRAKGRGNRINKRTSNITVRVTESEEV